MWNSFHVSIIFVLIRLGLDFRYGHREKGYMYSSTASRTHHGNNVVSIRDKILYMLPFHVQLGEASSSISFTSSFYLLLHLYSSVRLQFV